MAQYLISLLSEQTIPNVLFIRSVSHIDGYIFVTTAKMQARGSLDWILKVCPQVVEPRVVPVDAESYAEIRNKLESLIAELDPDSSFVVNLTGGTKLMALAAYECFRNRNSHIFYLPPLQNCIQELYPAANPEFRKVETRLTPLEFFTAYGLIAEVSKPDPLPEQLLRFMFDFVASSKDPTLPQSMSMLGSANQGSGSSVLKDKLCAGLNLSLHQLEEPFWRKFVKGQWFEDYLAHYFRMLDPNTTFNTNCIIQKSDISNEIDLAFTRENRLFTIEAKVSAKTADVRDFLFKIDALNRNFGLFPVSCLAVAARLSERLINGPSDVRQRAQAMGIRIFSYSDLHPDVIGKTIRSLALQSPT